MAVQDEASFKRYAANGVATVYAIPFLLLAAADLQVTLDGELVTSGFTVIGLGSNTGQIQFAAAPAGDLLLQRVVPFQRLTDYQDNGDLLSGTVNRDLDRLWLAVQELRRDDGRALVVSPLEPEGIPPLPVRALRQLRMLAFDLTGNPIPSNLTLEQLEQQPALAASAAEAAVEAAAESASSADAAELLRDQAQGYAEAAALETNASQAAALLAQRWANEDEDVPVVEGPSILYSAKHWALKAAGALAGLIARVTALENVGKPFTKEYVSAEQTITAAGLLNLSHDLGVKPKHVALFLKCVLADQGYSAGQETQIGWGPQDAGGSWGANYTATSSVISLRIGATGRGFIVINMSTGVMSDLTSTANWRLIVRAWA